MPHIHELYDFTASAFVLHPDEQKLLLIKHRKIGKWLQPGGHVELDENPLQALEHELEEETGLTAKDWDFFDQPDQPSSKGNVVLPIPFHFNVHPFNDDHSHIDMCYLVKSNKTKLTDAPDGADDIGWFTIDEITNLHSRGEVFDNTLEIARWIVARYFQAKV